MQIVIIIIKYATYQIDKGNDMNRISFGFRCITLLALLTFFVPVALFA